MQARSVSTPHQLLSRAIERAAFFADPGGYSFSPSTLYEELDGYAKIAYCPDCQSVAQIPPELLPQFGI